MILRPPRSTLFPTRRSSDLSLRRLPRGARVWANRLLTSNSPPNTSVAWRQKRSEEHTSELQSHSDLVCRLLLEKKKINNNRVRNKTKNIKHNIEVNIYRMNR